MYAEFYPHEEYPLYGIQELGGTLHKHIRTHQWLGFWGDCPFDLERVMQQLTSS